MFGKGISYLFVIYEYDHGYIDFLPLKTQQAGEMKTAFTSCFKNKQQQIH